MVRSHHRRKTQSWWELCLRVALPLALVLFIAGLMIGLWTGNLSLNTKGTTINLMVYIGSGYVVLFLLEWLAMREDIVLKAVDILGSFPFVLVVLIWLGLYVSDF